MPTSRLQEYLEDIAAIAMSASAAIEDGESDDEILTVFPEIRHKLANAEQVLDYCLSKEGGLAELGVVAS